MSRVSIYTPEQKRISNRYSSIKNRVKYNLEDYWSRENFIEWYEGKEKFCCYCKCNLKELKLFYDLIKSKRKTTRGQTLEIERIEDIAYSEDNCDLSCYWCNNAKSDVFTYDEFLIIGKTIGKVIKNKIMEEKNNER